MKAAVPYGFDGPEDKTKFRLTVGVADVNEVDAGWSDVQLTLTAESQTSRRQ